MPIQHRPAYSTGQAPCHIGANQSRPHPAMTSRAGVGCGGRLKVARVGGHARVTSVAWSPVTLRGGLFDPSDADSRVNRAGGRNGGIIPFSPPGTGRLRCSVPVQWRGCDNVMYNLCRMAQRYCSKRHGHSAPAATLQIVICLLKNPNLRISRLTADSARLGIEVILRRKTRAKI